MLRRITSTLLALCLVMPLPASAAEGSTYADVPPDDWSVSAIEKATEYGLMQGIGDSQFGYGNMLNRASFVTILCRMFGWETVTPAAPSYGDCATDAWYYAAVETALKNGALEPDAFFRPMDDISRQDMAVMLVRALDYDQLAQSQSNAALPFSDVRENRGYIALAYRFGIINGVEQKDGSLLFFPTQSAPREQAAAMLVRTYEKLNAKIDWLHGFYAFTSYSQIDMTAKMDGVSLGWSRMSYDSATGPWLNQTTSGSNEWAIPSQSAAATDYFTQNSTPYNLSVYASAGDSILLADGSKTSTVAAILATKESRAQAISALTAVAGAYAGVTIDFEALRAPLKDLFSAFLTELRAALPAGKTLYVCVQPNDWYDGYDYRAIGNAADKVILMAHDYQWTTVPADYVGTTKTDNPVTPFPKIYSALAAITDPATGVQDKDKLALAIAIASAGTEVDKDGKIASTGFFSPGSSTLINRLRQPDAERGWSDVYRNAYVTYLGDDGKSRYRIWYEDARAVTEKVELAHMFGVDGVSLWRLGNIPNYADPGLDYDVWSALLADR